MKAGNTEKWGNIGVGPEMKADGFSKIYPNPMSSSAMIQFTLDAPADVRIAIHNSVGQEVRRVMNEFRSAGTHTVNLERGDLSQGLYFCTIKAGNQSETQKLMIAK